MTDGLWYMVDSSKFDLSFLTTTYGIENIALWIIAFLIFLWLISIIWVAKDISARTNSTLLQIVSILLVTLLTPIIWLPLYKIIKPVWYKKDTIPRREACITNTVTCYNCKSINPKEYACCINCWEKLKTTCKQCGKEFPHIYHYCSCCWAPNIEI